MMVDDGGEIGLFFSLPENRTCLKARGKHGKVLIKDATLLTRTITKPFLTGLKCFIPAWLEMRHRWCCCQSWVIVMTEDDSAFQLPQLRAIFAISLDYWVIYNIQLYHNFPQLRQSEVMWLQAKSSKARQEENKNTNLYNQHYMLCTCRTRKTRRS